MKVQNLNSFTPAPWAASLNRTGLSDETKQVFKLGNDIKKIEGQTQYIKQNGEAPPSFQIDYLKKLNTI
jgi:hypothetical protein